MPNITHFSPLLLSIIFILGGCNIFDGDNTQCEGPRPQCPCPGQPAATCTEGRWVCACSPSDMSDATMDLNDGDLSSLPDMAKDMTLVPDMSTLDCSGDAISAPFTEEGVGSQGKAHTLTSGLCLGSQSQGVANTSDAFYFVHQPAQGDFDLVTQFLGAKNTGSLSQLGIMVRKTTAEDSPFVMLSLTGTKTPQLIYRKQPAQAVAFYGAESTDGPQWLRLVRQGQTFIALISENKTTWTRLGQVTADFGGDVLVGLAAASVSGEMMEAFFGDFSASPFDASSCPAALQCARPFLGADEAQTTGLDHEAFIAGYNFFVTNTNDSGPGSLRQALLDAAPFTQDKLYAIIKVDMSLKKQVLRLQTTLPIVKYTWIQGNGLILRGADEEPVRADICAQDANCTPPPVAFKLGTNAIIDGLTIEYMHTAIEATGAASGFWIRRNTFGFCSAMQLNLANNTTGSQRHYTLSFNRFNGSVNGKRSQAIQTQVCVQGGPNCDDDASKTFASIHHNYFTKSLSAWMPAGGGRFVYYNNYAVDALDGEFIDLYTTGQVWSAYNVFESDKNASAYVRGQVQSIGDIFLKNAGLGLTSSNVIYQPAYTLPMHTNPESVRRSAIQYAGAPR